MTFLADLHTHSRVSDGTDTPQQLIRFAKDAGLDCVALTDHDTTFGWAEARKTAEEVSISFIPGIEITCEHNKKQMHLLAYLVDAEDQPLRDALERMRKNRVGRAQKMVERINTRYPLTWEYLTDMFPDPDITLGRPHIADALVSLGYFATRSSVFKNFLKDGSPYVVEQERLQGTEAIQMVREAGGVPVIAHAMGGLRSAAFRHRELKELVEAGMLGVERDHREHIPSQRNSLQDFATTHGLIVTGSSDYHGSGKANALGENTTTEENVRRILDAGTGSTPYWVY